MHQWRKEQDTMVATTMVQILWLAKSTSRDEVMLNYEEFKAVPLTFMSYACFKALVSISR